MRNRGAYNVDPRLKHRVHQFLKTHDDQFVDISAMASELQQQFRTEYGRRNRTAFRIQVEKVHAVICSESDICNLENTHMAKRARRSREEGGDSDVSECSTDSEDDIPEHEHTNLMNSSLTSLYQRGASGSNPQSGEGWVLDNTGDAQENICIDLCEDESASPAKQRTAPRKPRSKSGKLKRRKKSKQDEDVDDEISDAILQKHRKIKTHELQHSAVKFEDFGGSDETLQDVCKLLIHMRHPGSVPADRSRSSAGDSSCTGRQGVGKHCSLKLWPE
ncbi:hypothetical protein R3I94_013155 [Phoxinus phoxinus]